MRKWWGGCVAVLLTLIVWGLALRGTSDEDDPWMDGPR